MRLAPYVLALCATALLVNGCSAPAPADPAPAVVELDTSAWIDKTSRWMRDNYDGVLRDWTLADGGEEWLYEQPHPARPRDPFEGCVTRNFFGPERPTHLVCFGPDKRVTRVIRRGEPGWRTLPLPERAK
jgi:hypothetical protein